MINQNIFPEISMKLKCSSVPDIEYIIEKVDKTDDGVFIKIYYIDDAGNYQKCYGGAMQPWSDFYNGFTLLNLSWKDRYEDKKDAR